MNDRYTKVLSLFFYFPTDIGHTADDLPFQRTSIIQAGQYIITIRQSISSCELAFCCGSSSWHGETHRLCVWTCVPYPDHETCGWQMLNHASHGASSQGCISSWSWDPDGWSCWMDPSRLSQNTCRRSPGQPSKSWGHEDLCSGDPHAPEIQ